MINDQVMAATDDPTSNVLCTAAHAGKIVAIKTRLQGLAEEDDEGRHREVDVGGSQPPRTGLEFRAPGTP